MKIKQKIEEIWTTNNSLGTALPELIDLLQLARSSQEQIPVELQLDILMTANYVMEYGTTRDSLFHLSQTWLDVMKELEKNTSISNDLHRKINRFNSIFVNALLGSLVYDKQNKMSETSSALNTVLHFLNLPSSHSNTIEFSLQSIVHLLLKFLDVASPTSWFLDNVFDLVTVLSILEDLNCDATNFRQDLDSLKSKIKRIDPELTLMSNIPIQTEKYRFISIMMDNANPLNETWLKNAKYLIE